MPEDVQKALGKFAAVIYGDLIIRLDDNNASTEEQLYAFLNCIGLFPSETGKRFWEKTLMPLIKKESNIAPLFSKAFVGIDLEGAIDKEIQDLAKEESQNELVAARVSDLQKMQDGLVIDFRRELLLRVLNEGYLSGFATASEVIGAVQNIENAFSPEIWWTNDCTDRKVGENIGIWIEEQEDTESRLAEVKDLLLKREVVLHDKNFDGLTIGALCFAVLEDYGGSIEERREWLLQNTEPGALRNALAGEALYEVYFKAHEEAKKIDFESVTKFDDILSNMENKILNARRNHVRERLLVSFRSLYDITYFPEIDIVYVRNPRLNLGQDYNSHWSLKFYNAPSGQFYIPAQSSIRTETVQIAYSVSIVPQASRGRYFNFLRTLSQVDSAGDEEDVEGKRSILESAFSPVLNPSEFVASVVVEDRPHLPSTAKKLINHTALVSRQDYPRFKNEPGCADYDSIGQLPEGEFRDHLVIQQLADALIAGYSFRERWSDKLRSEISSITYGFTLLDSVDSKVKKDAPLSIERCLAHLGLISPDLYLASEPSSSLDATKVGKIQEISELMVNDDTFLRRIYRAQDSVPASDRAHDRVARRTDLQVDFISLPIATTEVGTSLFQFFNPTEADVKKVLTDGSLVDRVTLIDNYFRFPAEIKDRYLIRILDIEEEKKTDGIYSGSEAKTIYGLLLSPQLKAYVGEKIYQQEIERNPEIKKDFEQLLRLILDTHPPGSIRREKALRKLYEGSKESPSLITTFEQHEKVQSVLKEERDLSRNAQHGLLRSAGIGLVQEVLSDPKSPISTAEKADTLLWLAGIKEKSKLVKCVEIVEGLEADDLRRQNEKLNDDEKASLLETLLSGPGGILTDKDVTTKKLFLDHIFVAVLDQSSGFSDPVRQRFKAIFDTILLHAEPERAGALLGKFLVTKLEGGTDVELFKTFLECIRFIGPKTGQYLVSQTTLLPEKYHNQMLDMTSRVDDNIGKSALFPRLEMVYGPVIRKVVHSIEEWLGGGSGSTCYKIHFWNEERTEIGWSGVVVEQKGETVVSLPEDLSIVGALVETIEAAPWLFGGKSLTTDYFEQLLWDTACEFNLDRVRDRQAAFAGQVQEIPESEKFIPVEVPDLKLQHGYREDDGTRKEISLARGPFLFMTMGEGITLDRLIKAYGKDPDFKEHMLQPIATSLARISLHQWQGKPDSHGRKPVELCDEHAGNIIVDIAGDVAASRKNIKIKKVTLIDTALSVEISEEISEVVRAIMRIAIGSETGKTGKTWREKFSQRMAGLGSVETSKGKQWLRDALDILETTAGVEWNEKAKEAAIDKLWPTLINPDLQPKAKYAAFQEALATVGITLPRDVKTFIRGLGIRDWLWGSVEWKKLSEELKSLNPDRKNTAQKLDIDTIVARISLMCSNLSIDLQPLDLRKKLATVNRAKTTEKRVENLFRKMKEHFEAIIPEKGEREAKLNQLLQKLKTDRDFIKMISGDSIFGKISRILGDQKNETELPAWLSQLKKHGSDVLVQMASDADIGHIPLLWKERLEPGTLLKAGKGLNERLFVVMYDFENRREVGEIRTEQKEEFAYLDTFGLKAEDIGAKFDVFMHHIHSAGHYREVHTIPKLLSEDLALEVYDKKQKTWTPIENKFSDSGESKMQYRKRIGKAEVEYGKI